MVIINPENRGGSVYTSQHLKKIAEVAKKLGIVVIADEVYDHLKYTICANGDIWIYCASSYTWFYIKEMVSTWLEAWLVGWIVTCDPNTSFQNSEIIKSIVACLDVSPDAPTFIQAAIPQILENTKDDLFLKNVEILRRCADICFDRLNEIPCITCSSKPEGSMFFMVKLDLSLLDDISDDVEFSLKHAKEESVIVLPGVTVGLKNWLQITFVCDHSSLDDGLGRIKAFTQRHAKKQ